MLFKFETMLSRNKRDPIEFAERSEMELNETYIKISERIRKRMARKEKKMTVVKTKTNEKRMRRRENRRNNETEERTT